MTTQLEFQKGRLKANGQAAKTLKALRQAGGWVSAWTLHEASGSLAIRNRIGDLIDAGYVIEHRNEWVDGKCHSQYRLIE